MLTKKERVWQYFQKNPREAKATNKEVANALGLSRKTVQRARRGFKDKYIPRILILDIETSPMVTFVWGLYKQRLNPNQIVKDWSIISWSAKWLFEDKVMGEVVTGEEANAREDWRIISEAWHLLDEADILIGQNVQSFDRRKLNARFILAGHPPPSSYQVIDTLKVSQKHFAFASHKLDYLGQLLLNKKKIKTDYDLWKRCVNEEMFTTGEDQEDALQEMLTYNKGDVLLTEEVYLELRPWITSHPNLGLYVSGTGEVCANCGSKVELSDNRKYYTPAGRFKSYRCGDCGAIGRSRYSDLKDDERKALFVGVAR